MTAAWTPRAAGPLAYAAALVLAVALTGCASGGSTPPVPSPTSTTPPASTSSPPPTPSATTTTDPAIAKIPAAANPETIEGAEAFAKFYVTSLNRAWTKPDASLLEGLSEGSCKTCVAFLKTAQNFETEGMRHDRPTLRVTSATTATFTASSRVVNLFIDQQAVHIVDGAGKTIDTTSSGRGALVLTLRYASDHWVITRLQTAKS